MGVSACCYARLISLCSWLTIVRASTLSWFRFRVWAWGGEGRVAGLKI